MAKTKSPFTFAISLSVLDHLGRHLYRSFGTVLGEVSVGIETRANLLNSARRPQNRSPFPVKIQQQ